MALKLLIISATMKIFSKYGFTLVEIMIVVAIIGLLSLLSVPAIMQSYNNARARRFAREIKAAGHAFVQYASENGEYPADKTPAQMPNGMAEYLKNFPWNEESIIGGRWDWDYRQFGTHAGVSIYQPDWGDEQMVDIDAIIDDGNLSTGQFRKRSGGYMYVLEEL